MLQILNGTRLPAALTVALDQHGAENLCVAVKGTFSIPIKEQEISVADEPILPQYTDLYFGEPGASSIKYPADLILGKPNTDVLLVGSARSARPVKQLQASVRVGPLHKRVLVTGNRRWDKRSLGLGFHMTEPVPFREMPLVYERAFGGSDQADPNEKRRGWDKRNPVGTGFRVSQHAVEGTAVPNLEDPDHRVSSWNDRPPVAGVGALDGLWEPRSQFAGTYDEKWLTTQAPLPPSDFDLRFFNTAPEGLIAKGFLRGGEPVELVNVGKDERVAFRLPDVEIALTLHLGDGADQQRADLWTVLLEPDERRFCMVWGKTFSVGKRPSQAFCVEVDVDGPMTKELKVSKGA